MPSYVCAFDPTGISETLAATFAASSTTAATTATAATAATTTATAATAATAGAGITTAQAGLALSAIGAGVQYYGQTKAQDAQRAQMNLQAQRQRDDAIRVSRIAFANSQNSQAVQGNVISSSAIGQQGSIQTQLGANLSFLDQYNDLSRQESHGLMFAGAGGAAEKAGFTTFANSDRINRVFS